MSAANELFYGGAAGGGKTDLLLGVGGTAQYRSLILRRIFPSVRSIIERSREIYNCYESTRDKDSYNESLHIWRLTSGRMVEFGSLQHDKNIQNYRGRPYDFYGWDEITEFTELQYRFVTAWNRSAHTLNPADGTPLRCRVIATGNPPTNAQGRWVVSYWGPWLDKAHPNPAPPGELRWFAMIDGRDEEIPNGDPFEHKGEIVTPKSRTFIPAKLADNPHLANGGYMTVVQNLPEPLRSQLLYGDFSAGVQDEPWQVIPSEWIALANERWRAGCPSNDDGEPLALTSLGVDVARGGADKTVVAKLYGNWIDALVWREGRDTDNGEKVAALVKMEWDGRAHIALDVIGLGASPYDHLRGDGIPVWGVNFGASSQATDRTKQFKFFNLRAQAYWQLREALDPSNPDGGLALPPDAELAADLIAPTWEPTPNGIKIESKDDIKKRIQRSTDKGDAVALALLAIHRPKPTTNVYGPG